LQDVLVAAEIVAMSLTYLTTETMLHLSQGWLDPQGSLPILEQHDLTRGLLEHLRSNRRAMRAASQSTNDWDQKLEELSREQFALDYAHDQQVRGLFQLLGAMAELCEQEASATELLELRQWLFPQGLDLVRRSYVEEAGHGGYIEEQLTPELRKKLKAISWKISKQTTNLLLEVEKWLAASRELGKREAEKLQLQSLRSTSKSQNRSRTMNQVRQEWIRLVHALRTNLDLVAELSASEREHVLGLLTKQEQEANKRVAQKRRSKSERSLGTATQTTTFSTSASKDSIPNLIVEPKEE
jgi:hypothetical protein